MSFKSVCIRFEKLQLRPQKRKVNTCLSPFFILRICKHSLVKSADSAGRSAARVLSIYPSHRWWWWWEVPPHTTPTPIYVSYPSIIPVVVVVVEWSVVDDDDSTTATKGVWIHVQQLRSE